MRETYMQWVNVLNRLVIRQENLKQYTIIEELGVGAQANVYKIIKK